MTTTTSEGVVVVRSWLRKRDILIGSELWNDALEVRGRRVAGVEVSLLQEILETDDFPSRRLRERVHAIDGGAHGALASDLTKKILRGRVEPTRSIGENGVPAVVCDGGVEEVGLRLGQTPNNVCAAAKLVRRLIIVPLSGEIPLSLLPPGHVLRLVSVESVVAQS